jgi:predicted transglutaminase-like cysteine proteinase
MMAFRFNSLTQYLYIALAAMLITPAMMSFAVEFKNQLLEVVEQRFGSDAAQRLVDWQSMAWSLKQSHTQDVELAQLKQVNDFFNQAAFVDDIELWGDTDYWATPVELLAKNAGDCEDYAIAKFFTLLFAGVDESKLQISYVKALELNQAHMVLAYYPTPNSEPLILDNINKNILPASQRTDLEPVYGFNGLGVWLNRFSRSDAKRVGDPSIMNNWSDMLRRQGILMLQRESNK